MEKRLPVNVNSYHNMELYLSEPKLFDVAVREMTRLFSKTYLGDLVGRQHHPLGRIMGVGDFVRYDNLPLYIEEKGEKKEGKIGLIDLENIQFSPSSQGLYTLARIFPYHVDMIKEEAKKLGLLVDNKALEEAERKGKLYLKKGLKDHCEWLQKKNISSQNVNEIFEISSERMKELTDRIEKELIKLNNGENAVLKMKGYAENPPKNFFMTHPTKIAKDLAEELTPTLMKNICTVIKKKQKKQLEKFTQDMTRSEVVNLRSPLLKRPKLIKTVDKIIRKHPRVKLSMREAKDTAEKLLLTIMDALLDANIIFYFDPAFYTYGHDLCWLRY